MAAELAECLPGRNPRLLRRIVGVGARDQGRVRRPEDGPVVPMDELGPGVGHAPLCAGHELLVGHRACRLTAWVRGWES